MEHKLITGGGEQYLPFARSRIQALRALGTAYASRRWTMPGGEIVAIRIEGEHEYIKIEGGHGLIAMDSGLVDLKGIDAHAPARYTGGTLLDTYSTAAYDAPFVVPAIGTGVFGSWRSNASKNPSDQLAGTVEVPNFVGHIKANRIAPSFEASRVAPNPPTNPVTWTHNTADDALAAKKYMAAKVPASVFTGRTRLYVQAMYGRPLYTYSSENTVAPQPAGNAAPGLNSIGPPALSLPAYKRTGDTVTYDPVIIDTSTGLYFEASTGKHWLLKLDSINLTIYPLLSSNIGEKLRKYLVAGTKITGTANTLTSDAIDKLEAFILAYCLPDVKNAVQLLTDNGNHAPMYSMGYGWHWNWSGTAANIVINTTFSQPPVNTGGQFQARQAMESTHKRISVTKDADGTWTAHMSVIEGPTKWAVHRAYWCITEPVWSDMSTSKTTPRDSTLFACDAPFYVFYLRDELRVCRVNVIEMPAEVNAREMSVGFATSSVYGSFVDEITCGDLNGFLIDRPSRGSFFRAKFSCGSLVYDQLDMPWTATGHRFDITKTSYTKGALGFDNTFGGDKTFESGYPSPFGNGYVLTTFTGTYPVPSLSSPPTVQYPHLKETDSNPTVFITRRERDVVESTSSTATIIVPFYDAEAVFMEGTRYVASVESGITVNTMSSTGYGTQTTRWVAVNQHADASLDFEPRETFIKWKAASGGVVLTTTHPANTTIENDTVVGKNLVCRAGTINATMNDLASFHDNALEAASIGYSALTGVRNIFGVAIAPPHIDPVGLADPSNVPTFGALVGWV